MSERRRTLVVYEGDCGHRWIGSASGNFACPTCGRHDGDRLPVQLEDWGCDWSQIAALAKAQHADRPEDH